MYIKSRLFFVNFILYILAVLVLLFALLISPLYLVRWQKMVSGRIGHFATNIELYCCERDSGINIPKQRYIDLFYTDKEVCNNQLKTMWKREITIVPYLFGRILSKSEKLIFYLESIFPIIKSHIIGIKTSEDRDIYNLLEKFTKHLEFTPYEENIGRQQLKDAGIPANAKFVCLISRDDAYLNSLSGGYDWSHHDFRNADIQTFVMAAEELAEMGYYVFRMGSVVNEPIRTEHPRVIDYATSAMRNDFMDIYLGAKCYFCISVSTDLMYESGCRYIDIAIESGSERVINEIVKKPIDHKQAIRLVKYARKKGIFVSSNFIIGFPGETWDEILETISFAEILNVDYAKIFIAIPLKNTEMYDQAVEQNLLKDDSAESVWTSGGMLETKEFSSEDLTIFRAYEWERINFSDIKKRKKIADRMGISLDELSIIRKRTLLNARNKVANRTISNNKKDGDVVVKTTYPAIASII